MNDAAPIGASIIIWSGEAILLGNKSVFSQLFFSLTRKFETLNPTIPNFGLAPVPVAPSSLISPPEPVAAPGNGEIAVG